MNIDEVNYFFNKKAFKEVTFTIEDATKLIKDMPEKDFEAYIQGFKILYPNL